MVTDSFHSAIDLSNSIKDKQISPLEVMDDCIESIEARNPSINALVFTALDEARENAAKLEQALMAGEARGDFFGIPTAYKDFLPGVPGWPTSFGGIEAARSLDTGWSLWAKTMVEQGAILVGRTNAPTLALRGVTDNMLYGPTSTPFKVGWNSGGSSGGSCSAVADGLFRIANTSDAGGSTRIPAAWCGVYGFKNSVGTVSVITRPNGWSPQFPYCIEGHATRTVKDTAYALQHLAGFDPRDPLSYERGEIDYIGALDGSMKGWCIGYTTDFGIYPVDPEIAEAVRNAAKRFEDAGATVEEVEFSFERGHLDYAETWCRTASVATFSRLRSFKAQGIDLLRDHPD